MADNRNQTSPNFDIEDPDDIAVTLSLDDGTELECGILKIFTVDDRDYIALLPYDEKGQMQMDQPAMLYRYFEDEDENGSLDNIETDAEYEAVEKAFFDVLSQEGL